MLGNKTLLWAAVLGCVGVLALSDPVSAQYRGGVSHGGYHAGAGNYYHNYSGLGYHSGVHYYPSGHYYSGFRTGGYPYYRNYYGGYNYSYPRYNYSYLPQYYGYNYGYSAPGYVDQNYVAPAASYSEFSSSYYQPPAANTVPVNKAVIQVTLPNPEGSLWVEGYKMETGGTVRTFETPPLDPGNYTYHIIASWPENGRLVTQERDVAMTPGQKYVVDFTQPAQTQ